MVAGDPDSYFSKISVSLPDACTSLIQIAHKLGRLNVRAAGAGKARLSGKTNFSKLSRNQIRLQGFPCT